jgi:hypothetical protein
MWVSSGRDHCPPADTCAVLPNVRCAAQRASPRQIIRTLWAVLDVHQTRGRSSKRVLQAPATGRAAQLALVGATLDLGLARSGESGTPIRSFLISSFLNFVFSELYFPDFPISRFSAVPAFRSRECERVGRLSAFRRGSARSRAPFPASRFSNFPIFRPRFALPPYPFAAQNPRRFSPQMRGGSGEGSAITRPP